MSYKTTRKYLMSMPEAAEDFPFGSDVAVFKLKGKMFATLSMKDGVPQMNLKCDPDEALGLRDMFDAIIPGYHMNKKHWNTIILDGSVPKGQIEIMIENSYGLVFKGLKKAERQSLELTYTQAQLFQQ